MKIKNLAVTFLSLFMLMSCDNKSADNNENLIVALSADNPPYEFIQEGNVVGLDIDIIEEIGKILEKKIVIKNLDFPGLFPALTSNNVDCIISGLSVTENRKEYFDFSDTYTSSQISVIFRKDDNLKNSNDLNGKIIGAQLGSTWEMEANNIAKEFPGTMVRALSNNLVLIEELKSGSVDAVILEKMQVDEFIKNNPSLSFFDAPELKSDFAIAFNKNSELVKQINEAIQKLQNNGKLEYIKKKWLKSQQ